MQAGTERFRLFFVRGCFNQPAARAILIKLMIAQNAFSSV